MGEEVARSSLVAAIDGALASAPGEPASRAEVTAVVAGLAGIDAPGDEERLTRLVREALPASRVSVCNDGEVALAAATGGGAGVVVVAGTGSVAFGADAAGHIIRCGGWGHIFGDEGSGYAIVEEALRRASYAVDGRGPPSMLVDALTAALHLTVFDDIVHRVYGPPPLPRHDLAALAPLVAQCAEAGDAVARAVLAGAGQDLAEMAVFLARRLGLCDRFFPVGYSGGVWKIGSAIVTPFRQYVLVTCPHATVRPPLLAPAAGAVLLAIGLLDHADAPTSAVLERLMSPHAYEHIASQPA